MSASAKRSRIVFLLSAVFSTGISMASSLVLLSATDLAGSWTLQQDAASASCELQLRADSVEAANGYALGGDTECVNQWLAGELQAWRPTPAGIALLKADGLTLLLLSRQGSDDYQGQHADGAKLVLRRSH
jgi:hypothetical protein